MVREKADLEVNVSPAYETNLMILPKNLTSRSGIEVILRKTSTLLTQLADVCEVMKRR